MSWVQVLEWLHADTGKHLVKGAECVRAAVMRAPDQGCEILVEIITLAHSVQKQDPGRCLTLVRLFESVADCFVQQLCELDKSLWLWSVDWLSKHTGLREFGTMTSLLCVMVGRCTWQEEKRWGAEEDGVQ